MNTNRPQGDSLPKDKTQDEMLNEALKDERLIKVESVLKAISYAIAFTGFLSIAGQVGIVFSSGFIALALAAVFLDFKTTPAPLMGVTPQTPSISAPISASISVSPHVPRWVVNTLSVIIISLSFYRLYSEDFVDTAVEAIMLLTAVKFLEDKKFRDYMQIYIMSVFMLAGSALMSIDLTFLFYFIVLFPLISTAIVILTYETEFPGLKLKRSDLRRIVSRALLIPLMSIPLAAVIFVILPRTNFHFLGFLNRAGVGRAGFTDNVKLGEVSSIQLDSSVVFRAQMQRLNENQLYWRGIVFDEFDGTAWKSVDMDTPRNQQEFGPKGKRVNQTIYLEPYDNRYLFTLDIPVYVSGIGAYLSNNFTLKYFRNINSTMRYDVVSVPPEASHLSYPDSINDIAKYIRLPGNFSPTIISLAKSLTTGMTKRQSIVALYNYLHNGQFRYALDKLPISARPLEEFLFTYRYGNCEYFASAMAVMLRSIGIPARLVGGYKAGQYNNVGKYYIVLQKNAHVWVEAFLPDAGWIRIDPTAPRQSTSFTVGNIGGAGLLLDTMNYYWNSFIINYNINKQLSALRALHDVVKIPYVKIHLGKIKVAHEIIAVFSLVVLLALVRNMAFHRLGTEQKLLAGFYRRLGKYGYVKGQGEGLEEFAGRIEDKALRAEVYRFIRQFEGIFYRDGKFTGAEVARLKELQTNISTVLKAVPPKEKAP